MNTQVLLCSSPPVHPIEPAAHVSEIDNLCRQPELIAEYANGADRLVLALHRDDYALAEVQAQARLLRLDPFGVQIVHVEGEPSATFGVTLSGLMARAEAFTGSKPDHAKAVFPRRLSRRTLLTVPKPEYTAVPDVDRQTCVAADGCRACVDVCPQDAYRWNAGRVVFNKDACEPCGRCVTGCPVGAVTNPTVAPAQVRAQLEAIVLTSVDPVGISFVCRRGRAELPDWWHAIEVPCTAMVPGSWLVATLMLGAAAATALPCGPTGCPLEQDATSGAAVGFARALLTKVGENPDRVPRAVDHQELLSPIEPVSLDDPFGPQGPVEVVLALMSPGDRRSVLELDHPGAPTGIVEINADTCTACLACATTCPTDALGQDFTADRLTLSFDAARCCACGQCISRCPEIKRDAISMTRRVDTRLLGLGPQVVHESPVSRCVSCGSPVASVATLDRLDTLLGPEHAGTMEYLSTRCLDCRGKW